MNRYLVFLALSIWFVASISRATEPGKSSDDELDKFLRFKKWEEATRKLSDMEKASLCAGATCLSASALILNAKGKTVEAHEAARQAAEKLSEERALSAWRYNELGALLYRAAAGKREDLQLAEAVFRRAAAVYQGRASNIRFNLAAVLNELERKNEAKKLMEELEAEGGIMVDPNMAILGDLKGPGKQ